MSDNSSKFKLVFLPTVGYAMVLIFSVQLLSDFLSSLTAKVQSQNRAAWAQVYWVRRGQLHSERVWQESWEAFEKRYSTEYCRVKLQDVSAVAKDLKESMAYWEEEIRKQESKARRTRSVDEVLEGHGVDRD